jgi:hypothetical protein
MKSSKTEAQACLAAQRRRVSAFVQGLLATESFPMMYNGFYCVFACQAYALQQRWLPASELMAALSKLTGNWQSKGLDARVMNRILVEALNLRPVSPETT